MAQISQITAYATDPYTTYLGLKQVYGQLIFSGYDASRFKENAASFTMADDLTRDLVVVLESISYSGGTSATLLSDAIPIFVDSTEPNLWLPSAACDAFEAAFGLQTDPDSGLYLVNETQHNALRDADAEVTFRLSDVAPGGGGESVSSQSQLELWYAVEPGFDQSTSVSSPSVCLSVLIDFATVVVETRTRAQMRRVGEDCQ